MRVRDQALERHLTDLAARAAGFTTVDPVHGLVGDDHGLRAFADHRTLPGPVRQRDFTQELREELADAANYAVWGIEEVYDAYLRGDPDAAHVYSKLMRALTHTVTAWVALVD